MHNAGECCLGNIVALATTDMREAISQFSELNAEFFASDTKTLGVFKLLEQFKAKYRTLPTREEAFNQYSISLPVSENIRFDVLLDKVKANYANSLINGLAAQPFTSIHSLRQTAEDIVSKLRLTESKSNIISLADASQEIITNAKSFKTNQFIKTGYPTIDEKSYGYSKEDLVIIAARPNVGKTWMLLHLLMSAIEQDKRFLMLSLEMSWQQLVVRMMGAKAKVNPSRIKTSNLCTYDLDSVSHKTSKYQTYDKGYFYKSNEVVDVDKLRRALDASRPEALFVDSAYLLNSKTSNSKDRFAPISESIMNMNKLRIEYEIPVLCSYQLNREAIKQKEGQAFEAPGLDTIYGSDTIGQLATLVYIMVKWEGYRKLYAAKAREAGLYELCIHHDFENFNFAEVGRENPLPEDDIMNSFLEHCPEEQEEYEDYEVDDVHIRT